MDQRLNIVERFKAIPEYPEYLISKEGEVFSTKSNRLLSIRAQTRGYLYFSVSVQGKQSNILLHRALARVFLNLDRLDDLSKEVDHKDTVILNNDLSNLQGLSKKDHSVKTTIERGYTPIEGNVCSSCGVVTARRNKTGKCLSCLTLSKELPTLHEIEKEVITKGWRDAAPILGYGSDNGLRNRYKTLGMLKL